MSGDLKIRRAHAPVEPLEVGSNKYFTRIRIGKTKKDHASGAWRSRFANRDRRDGWLKEHSRNTGTFQASNNPVRDWPAGQHVPKMEK